MNAGSTKGLTMTIYEPAFIIIIIIMKLGKQILNGYIAVDDEPIFGLT
jgi:hypothetical protein